MESKFINSKRHPRRDSGYCSDVSSPRATVDDGDLYCHKDTKFKDNKSRESTLLENYNDFRVKNQKSISEFAASLDEAASRIFPNDGKVLSPYKSVNVLLISWEGSDLEVGSEVGDLQVVFKTQYGFNTEAWKIPLQSPHHKLTTKVLDFVDRYDSADSLLIVYYSGHGSLSNSRQSQWLRDSEPNSPLINWSATQTLLEQSDSDVLILLDTCHAASSTSNTGQGVTETIAACGFEALAPPPGPRSFTTCLTNVLREWAHKSFSTAMLHNEILFRLRHERPERTQKQMGLREVRSTPIHVISSADLRRPSINLSKLDSQQTSKANANPWSDVEKLFDQARTDYGSVPRSKSGRLCSKHRNLSSNNTQNPQVWLKIHVDKEQKLDLGGWKDWLSSIPVLVQKVKVEGRVQSVTKPDEQPSVQSPLPDCKTKSKQSSITTKIQQSTHLFSEFEGTSSLAELPAKSWCKPLPIEAETVVKDILQNALHDSFSGKFSKRKDFFREVSINLTCPLTKDQSTSSTKKQDFSKSTKIRNLCEQIALTTTTPPLPGLTRCSADEVKDETSQIPEEDYQWDISETADSVEDHELDETPNLNQRDALEIAKFLKSGSTGLKQEIVELLMNEYYQIFGKDDSPNQRKRPRGRASSNSNGRTSLRNLTNNSRVTNPKAGRKAGDDDKDWEDTNDNEPVRKRQRDNSLPESQKASRRFACPYHKHNPQKFRRAASRAFTACDNEGFDNIGHLKEHLLRAHYERNKCPRCKFVLRAPDFRSHIEQFQSCEPRAECQGDPEIGFSHCYGVWLKEKKRSATESESVARWREIYQKLFPDETIPNPFVSFEDKDSAIAMYSEQAASPVENQYNLQPDIVQAIFEDQVNAVIDPTINNLEPAVRGLLGQAPNTIRDEIDLSLPNWSGLDISSNPQPGVPGYRSSISPDYARAQENGGHHSGNRPRIETNQQTSRFANFNTNQSPNSWENNPRNFDFGSRRGEGLEVHSSNNIPEATRVDHIPYQSLDFSDIDNRIQTQVRVEVAPLAQSIASLQNMLQQALSGVPKPPQHLDRPRTEASVYNQTLDRRPPVVNLTFDNRPVSHPPDRDFNPGIPRMFAGSGDSTKQRNAFLRESGKFNGLQTPGTTVQSQGLSDISSIFDS